jgi:peptidoglycan/LPS O-acetylase OafA/YrhL
VFSFFTGFYRRRFIRIAPALFVYLAIFTALASYFIPKTSISGGIFETARWAIFGGSNIQLVDTSDGYFAERMDYNPFIQTWSLGVEEQFYLIYPLIMVALVFAISKSKRALQQASIVGISLLTALSLAICLWQTPNQPLNAFYLLPSRFWELAAGGLLYILVTRKNKQGKAKPSLYAAVGLGLIALSLAFANFEQFPFWWAIPPVLGSLLLIHSSNLKNPQTDSKLYRLVTAKPIVYFGKISYSLYLWHWGVFVLMRWTIGLTLWWHFALALAITVLASAISYRYVETPIRTGKFIRKLPDWRVIAAGTIAAALVFGSISFNKGEMIRRAEAIQDPQFKDSKTTIQVLSQISKLEIGSGQSLIFVGDSHAGHYKYMGHWIAKRTLAEFKSIIHVGCAYANLAGETRERPVTCPSQGDFTEEVLNTAKPGDVVVLSSFSVPRIAELDKALDREQLLLELDSALFEEARAKAMAETIEIVRTLQANGLTVVLAAPTPVFVSPPDRCIRWFNKMNPICAGGFREPVDYQLKLRAPVMESYGEVAEVTGATLWDPFPLLCGAEVCSSEKDGRYLYVDQHHLSSNGNLLLVASFLETLKTIWK